MLERRTPHRAFKGSRQRLPDTEPRLDYTAIDVASTYTWAELTPASGTRARATPASRCTAPPPRSAAAGWQLEQVSTDNGSEFRAREFRAAVEHLGARPPFIRADRPNSYGCVERVQLTILEECWRPAFARSLIPKMTAPAVDLQDYLFEYNYDRAHTGRLTQSTPAVLASTACVGRRSATTSSSTSGRIPSRGSESSPKRRPPPRRSSSRNRLIAQLSRIAA